MRKSNRYTIAHASPSLHRHDQRALTGRGAQGSRNAGACKHQQSVQARPSSCSSRTAGGPPRRHAPSVAASIGAAAMAADGGCLRRSSALRAASSSRCCCNLMHSRSAARCGLRSSGAYTISASAARWAASSSSRFRSLSLFFFLGGGDYEKTMTERNEAHFVAVSALLPLLPAEPVLPLPGVTALPRTPAHRHAALRLSLLDPRSRSGLLALVLCVAFLEYDRLRDSNSGSICARRFFVSRLRLRHQEKLCGIIGS